MSQEPKLVVIDGRQNPWRLTRFEGRTKQETAELIVPPGASSNDVAAVVESFRVRTPEIDSAGAS
jgi:hypothetical protein